MGKVAIQVNREELQMAIRALENLNSFSNRTQLWQAVENSDWAKSLAPRPLSGQMAMLKAKQFDLEIKTPLGRKGREKGSGPIPGGGRRKKKVGEDNLREVIAGLPVELKEKYAKTIEKFENGSLKAAVKLKCLDCCNWSSGEVGNCEMLSCTLWSHRPYKRESVVKELL